MLKRQEGFTLIQVLISLAILPVIALIVLATLKNLGEGVRFNSDRAEAEELRSTLKRILSDQVACTESLRNLNVTQPQSGIGLIKTKSDRFIQFSGSGYQEYALGGGQTSFPPSNNLHITQLTLENVIPTGSPGAYTGLIRIGYSKPLFGPNLQSKTISVSILADSAFRLTACTASGDGLATSQSNSDEDGSCDISELQSKGGFFQRDNASGKNKLFPLRKGPTFPTMTVSPDNVWCSSQANECVIAKKPPSEDFTKGSSTFTPETAPTCLNGQWMFPDPPAQPERDGGEGPSAGE